MEKLARGNCQFGWLNNEHVKIIVLYCISRSNKWWAYIIQSSFMETRAIHPSLRRSESTNIQSPNIIPYPSFPPVHLMHFVVHNYTYASCSPSLVPLCPSSGCSESYDLPSQPAHKKVAAPQPLHCSPPVHYSSCPSTLR